MFEAFRQDLRHALHHLRRSPTFTLGAALTLALGIGVSAAVFSALNALVLRPAPIKDPSGLIGVWPISARGQRKKRQPAVAASVIVFFLLLTIGAVLVPARRAARLDPAAALRAD